VVHFCLWTLLPCRGTPAIRCVHHRVHQHVQRPLEESPLFSPSCQQAYCCPSFPSPTTHTHTHRHYECPVLWHSDVTLHPLQHLPRHTGHCSHTHTYTHIPQPTSTSPPSHRSLFSRRCGPLPSWQVRT